jgi:hypothetical protein
VILEAGKPGSRDVDIFDTDTGEQITAVVRLDSETGFIERCAYVEGRPQISEDGKRWVHIEERRNFRVVHKPTGQLICQHPR